jgi:hypothetical protein
MALGGLSAGTSAFVAKAGQGGAAVGNQGGIAGLRPARQGGESVNRAAIDHRLLLGCGRPALVAVEERIPQPGTGCPVAEVQAGKVAGLQADAGVLEVDHAQRPVPVHKPVAWLEVEMTRASVWDV